MQTGNNSGYKFSYDMVDWTLVENCERILVAGVIAGEDDQIGQFSGDLAHDGALAVVAVAAAAEEGDEAALRGLAHGL